jgi:hypothetical protein
MSDDGYHELEEEIRNTSGLNFFWSKAFKHWYLYGVDINGNYGESYARRAPDQREALREALEYVQGRTFDWC